MQTLLVLAPLMGLLDSLYLFFEYIMGSVVVCGENNMFDCGEVLKSSYSEIAGIPLSLFGVGHYTVLVILGLLIYYKNKRLAKHIFVVLSTWGLLFSAYLFYIQWAVIGKFCLYCLGSAITSLVTFLIAVVLLKKYFKQTAIYFYAFLYKYVVKKIFFLIDPHLVHDAALTTGHIISKFTPLGWILRFLVDYKNAKLKQSLAGITFESPIGLAAGFDYEARLIGVLGNIGFGFGTIGTVTNLPSSGNLKPQLGRLPASKSLWVNKGFKNPGALIIASRISGSRSAHKVGVSIGVTNDKNINTIEKALEDIKQAFGKIKKASSKISYYEVNISCPNLKTSVDFYSAVNLEKLLKMVDKLKLNKPYFIKMPITLTNSQTLKLLKVISRSKATGVIFGNLEKNKNNKFIVENESGKFTKGGYSGRPTFERSNELINLAYKNYSKRFVIIGCGGVFGAADAYEKIKNGASLVQLITGMVFTGPQIASVINCELQRLIEEDGFKSISRAIGSKAR